MMGYQYLLNSKAGQILLLAHYLSTRRDAEGDKLFIIFFDDLQKCLSALQCKEGMQPNPLKSKFNNI